jgi:hypothetical protein
MELEERVKKLERLVKELTTQKKTWVKSPVITKLTGWDQEGMRVARRNGYVKWEKKKDGFWYLLESINEVFIKKEYGRVEQNNEPEFHQLQGLSN